MTSPTVEQLPMEKKTDKEAEVAVSEGVFDRYFSNSYLEWLVAGKPHKR